MESVANHGITEPELVSMFAVAIALARHESDAPAISAAKRNWMRWHTDLSCAKCIIATQFLTIRVLLRYNTSERPRSFEATRLLEVSLYSKEPTR